MPPCAQCCRILYNLFDNESDFGKITLRRMEQLVKEHMGERGMPTCETKWIEGKPVNVPALSGSLKDLLFGMVVEGCEVLALDKLRKLTRSADESDMGLVTRAQIIYQTVDK